MKQSPLNLVLQRRRAGILLHITSLPEGVGNGDMGHSAYRFIEFLAAAGVHVWQILPLCPTHEDRSPYLGLSAHAGNPVLISLDWLRDRDLLEAGSIDQTALTPDAYRRRCLQQAHQRFMAQQPKPLYREFTDFCHDTTWLEDFALYCILRQQHDNRPWWRWPATYRDRNSAALNATLQQHRGEFERIAFEQFIFATQWRELREYAQRHQVLMFGDMPIFVAHDSADVWSRPDYFLLDKHGLPRAVAGVPPDFFSATGQRWGNPLYNWNKLKRDQFSWWVERLRTELQRFDILRIDHFRGLQAYWSIPAEAKTAQSGTWVKAPGNLLLKRIFEKFDSPSLVAEDLGTITQAVLDLRDKYGLPGMKILQFAFDGNPNNPYLPHRHQYHHVVYTATHDNDTTLSWFQQLGPEARRHVLEYMQQPPDSMPWSFINLALASVAALAIVPMQDVLGLGAGHRMNTPGTEQGNWHWRFTWQQLPIELAARLRTRLVLYGRATG